ncbi:Glycosyltransferases, probably involved in cell wall biogenesis|uniref:Glycosyl transferase family 2 n=1 Tax=Brenneria salicis ATCC 15712 = DSM 30166 TaxID=714314 RepID=A0A366I3C5_9GAMM|nr:glycosyltransferase [Brenneria salicis]NMN92134.1 Glycosyltransferases, probably involved in cell wall biogenesis [Brenneria salicis ATCC 15712 = DSM 30166]RBP61124.1 glycosyl transferase family 2 [Brenneria salicis ATCC 15712 = DSM 30166]RLM29820.1 hypothetical protein BHG07_14195 [Brenneria salicis ATCC 15712 = DSM 30166]
MIKVLLAAYNGEKYIEQQLKSILSANHIDDLKVVISLDQSSDKTEHIVRNLHSPDIELIVHKDRLGSAKNNFSWLLNHVEEDAEYFMLADQDDFWFDDKIHDSILKIKEMESEFGIDTPCLVFTDSIISDENLNVKNNSFVHSSALDVDAGLCFERLVVKNSGQGCTFLFNVSLLRLLRNTPQEIIMHDWWIMLVAACFGKIYYIDKPAMIYRQHSSNEVGALNFDLLFIFKKVLKSNLHKNIISTQKQAEAFLNRFNGELSPKEKNFLQVYSGLHKMNPLKRRYSALKHGVKSAGLIRTVGLYVFM